MGHLCDEFTAKHSPGSLSMRGLLLQVGMLFCVWWGESREPPAAGSHLLHAHNLSSGGPHLMSGSRGGKYKGLTVRTQLQTTLTNHCTSRDLMESAEIVLERAGPVAS